MTARTASRQDRLARARDLQSEMEARYAQERSGRQARECVAREALVEGLDAGTLAQLAALPLHARRYRLPENTRAILGQMACRTLADVAALRRGRLDQWMGYRLADLVRERILAIALRARGGHPEPAIWRVYGRLDPDLRAHLEGEPLDRLAGAGIRRPLLDGIALMGATDLAALAEAELDDVEGVHGCGPSTLTLLQERLAAYIESLPRTKPGQADAEWEAAAPPDRRRPSEK